MRVPSGTEISAVTRTSSSCSARRSGRKATMSRNGRPVTSAISRTSRSGVRACAVRCSVASGSRASGICDVMPGFQGPNSEAMRFCPTWCSGFVRAPDRRRPRYGSNLKRKDAPWPPHPNGRCKTRATRSRSRRFRSSTRSPGLESKLRPASALSCRRLQGRGQAGRQVRADHGRRLRHRSCSRGDLRP